ncbi:beta-xylosidase [Rhizoctonia solani AG-1 IA]|uniref:Beta-xylosidase n=1 Tax=Thanatephorus cucumeris (strain AG1-IA) TaxID=983506 RepID=L8X360_THACA|nr:beta-xylosidase [Rhizoctonia solani AG-1 IA]
MSDLTLNGLDDLERDWIEGSLKPDSLPSQVHPSYPYGNPTKPSHPVAFEPLGRGSSRAYYDDMRFERLRRLDRLRWTNLALDLLLPIDHEREEALKAAAARKAASGAAANNNSGNGGADADQATTDETEAEEEGEQDEEEGEDGEGEDEDVEEVEGSNEGSEYVEQVSSCMGGDEPWCMMITAPSNKANKRYVELHLCQSRTDLLYGVKSIFYDPLASLSLAPSGPRGTQYFRVSGLVNMLFTPSHSLGALRGTTMGYQNPIIPGFNPDPTILRTGDDYFVATSTFEFFPGVPIYHSKDLIKWTTIGHAFNRPNQLMMRGTAPSGGIFAPTLRYNKDPVEVSMRNRIYELDGNLFAASDPVYVDQWGFDPDLFFDDDGKVSKACAPEPPLNTSGRFTSLALLAQTILGTPILGRSEIDIKTGDSLTESRFSHQSPLPLDTPRLAEGSHIYKINGTYYLMTAEAGTEVQHRAMSYRSKVGPYGPWEESPYNPIVFNGRNLSQPILSTGHADMVQTPNGDWWAVFLGTRPQNPTNSSGRPQLGRETFLAPVQWTKDGWYTINGGKDITFDMPGLYNLDTPKVWKDSLKGTHECMRDGRVLRHTQAVSRTRTITPYKAFHTFPKTGGLNIRGNIYSLSDRETAAAFFRKQSDISTVFSTKVKFTPTSTRHEAGITIYLSIHYHNEIGITINPGSNKTAIFATTRSGENATANTTYVDLPNGVNEARLFIKAEPSKYSLGYATGNGEPTYIASVDSKWLQAYLQGWQNFVGSHFGIYASSNGLPILQSAPTQQWISLCLTHIVHVMASTDAPAPAPTVESQATNPLTSKFTGAERKAVDELRVSEAYPDKSDASSAPFEIWGLNLYPERVDDVFFWTTLLSEASIGHRALDIDEAGKMLVATLKWRAEFRAADTINEQFDENVFGKLGYVHGKDKEGRPLDRYNVYGGDQDLKAIFGDTERFLRWRVGLMERGLREIDFVNVDSMVQVHDYAGVSMTSRDANSKKAAADASKLFQDYYPELLADLKLDLLVVQAARIGTDVGQDESGRNWSSDDWERDATARRSRSTADSVWWTIDPGWQPVHPDQAWIIKVLARVDLHITTTPLPPCPIPIRCHVQLRKTCKTSVQAQGGCTQVQVHRSAGVCDICRRWIHTRHLSGACSSIQGAQCCGKWECWEQYANTYSQQIVFKALIVLHSIIRQGQTDNVLKYLASSDVLRLRNVSNGQWDGEYPGCSGEYSLIMSPGYMAPQNIAHYAMYLDCRVRTYKDLKHDAIRVQSESNRDRMSTDDDSQSSRPIQRNKTVMGRKLRVMTVEKGLLRETKMVQRLTDSLLECKSRGRTQCYGLENACQGLAGSIPGSQRGCDQCPGYALSDAPRGYPSYSPLGPVMKSLVLMCTQAPVSLAKTLEEYLKDPNFEDNRLEYRNSKIIADGGSVSKKNEKAPEAKRKLSLGRPLGISNDIWLANPSIKIPENNTASSSTAAESAKPGKSELMDFFASIEQEQPSMFDPQSQRQV